MDQRVSHFLTFVTFVHGFNVLWRMPCSENAINGSEGRGCKQARCDYYPGMSDWGDCAAVERDAQRVGGAWVFRGTRVPVRALFENLEDGATVDDFLEWFPGVQRLQVESVLRYAEASLIQST